MTDELQIHLPSGTVRATVADGVLDGRGVRYGSAPARRGDPVEPPRVAQAEPTAFPQVPGLLDTLLGPALSELPQHEDSFSVRVQAPADAISSAALPVVLFVHGGGFTTGSAEARWYDAADLVRRGRIVLVTVNHRLGALATVAAPASATGTSPAFDDLLAAARWVRDHVDAFGGDPDDITVMGDSAGAWWAHALSTSPLAAGLFRRTVLVSMPRLEPLAPADDAARRELVAAHLGVDTASADTLDGLEVADVLAAQAAAARDYRGAGFPFAPAAGDQQPTWWGHPRESAAHLHTERVLCLTTAHEASAFLRPRGVESFTAATVEAALAGHFVSPAEAREALVPSTATPYEAAVAVQTYWQFQSPAQELAAAADVPVHLARLDVASPLPDTGSPHCFVLPFLFGDEQAWADAPMVQGLDRDLADRTRVTLQELLLAFVRDGDVAAPTWDDADPHLLAVGEGTRTLPAPAPGLEVRP